MLTQLHIENIAVIEKADIEFHGGLNVLTGETGAGKSIIVDSLGAILGARTSRELVRTGADKGLVSAVFETKNAENWLAENDIEAGEEIIIQRKISSDGKNSCRVCGMPVTVAQLRELGAYLLDIHGQNDGRQLADESRHCAYLDSYADSEELLEIHKANFNEYKQCAKEIRRISMDEVEKERLADSLKYQLEELENAKIKPGEEEELSQRRDLLRNSEKLTEDLDSAYGALYAGELNACTLSDEAYSFALRAGRITDSMQETADIIKNASAMLYDASERIKDLKESLDFSPEEYDNIESRLALLRKLQRKYNLDEDGLLLHIDECRKKLDELEYSDDMIKKLTAKLEKLREKCAASAKELSLFRKKSALELEKQVVEQLRDLSMPSVRFKVDVLPVENNLGFDENGCDDVKFLISANAGQELGRISKIASGGELSRIMLAMKTVFSASDPIETMVFDEIDTGVSGIAAQRVGEKLSAISADKQVLCITHLPQIAAIADSHKLIEKSEKNGSTYTAVQELDRIGRQHEIARLYGGDNISELTLASAEEQIAAADKYKLTRVI